MRHHVTGLLALALLATPSYAQEPPQYLLQWTTGGSSSLDRLFGIAADDSGRVYVADTFNDRVVRYTAEGEFQLEWGSNGSADGEFISPRGITVSGNQVLVTDLGNHRVQVFATDGTFISSFGTFGTGDGQFRNPSGVAVDTTGNIYVSEKANHRVQKFTSNGVYLLKWGRNSGSGIRGSATGEFDEPFGLDVDTAGNVYVADQNNHRIQKFTGDGVFVSTWGSLGEEIGEFNLPTEVSVGDDQSIYVADRGNHRIQVFDGTGTFVTTWGCFGPAANNFNFPTDVAIDGSCVYVADTFNDRVQKFGDPITYTIPAGVNVTRQLSFSTLKFESVATPGQLSERLSCCPVPLPGGIQPIPSDGGLFLNYEGAVQYTGQIEMCVQYNPAFVEGLEDNVFLIQYDPTAVPLGWRVIRSSIDTNTNTICGVTDTLGIYALVEPGNNQIGVDPMTPATTALRSFPNPFVSATRVSFTTRASGAAQLQVFDLLGRRVRTVMEEAELPAGTHEAQWDGRDARGVRQAPGVYFLRLTAPSTQHTQRVVLLR